MTIEEMKARKEALGLTNQDIATLSGVPLRLASGEERK